MNALVMVGVGWLVMAGIMYTLWQVQRRTGKAGIVDVAWGMGIALLTIGYALGAWEGNAWRRSIVVVLAGVWAVRLSWHVWVRLRGETDDARYAQLREDWGADADRRMLGFFQMQALASVFFSLPMLVAVQNPLPLGWSDGVGVVVWFLALVGEAAADAQLARFKRRSDDKSQVCRDGLWRYSRHPNYFFEWLHWWSYPLLAWYSWYPVVAILAPLAMYVLITRVTGIPPAEAQSLRSRGDAYRDYQRTTNAFFPWFPVTDGGSS